MCIHENAFKVKKTKSEKHHSASLKTDFRHYVCRCSVLLQTTVDDFAPKRPTKKKNKMYAMFGQTTHIEIFKLN